MGGDACARYWSHVDYFGWKKTGSIVLRHDGHTLDATLLSLGRRAWGAPNTRAVVREDGEDNQQNKNDGRTLHLILG